MMQSVVYESGLRAAVQLGLSCMWMQMFTYSCHQSESLSSNIVQWLMSYVIWQDLIWNVWPVHSSRDCGFLSLLHDCLCLDSYGPLAAYGWSVSWLILISWQSFLQWTCKCACFWYNLAYIHMHVIYTCTLKIMLLYICIHAYIQK